MSPNLKERHLPPLRVPKKNKGTIKTVAAKRKSKVYRGTDVRMTFKDGSAEVEFKVGDMVHFTPNRPPTEAELLYRDKVKQWEDAQAEHSRNWKAAIAKVDLTRFPMSIRVESFTQVFGGLALWLTANVVNRDEPGKTIPLTSQRVLPAYSTEERAFDFIRACARDFIIHELDECILVDGKRIYDPHPPEHPHYSAFRE